jgi:5-amino-6-(5-phospho-D-ribitylamino)uracil phosphatase
VTAPWLIALDIDGTVLQEDGTLSAVVVDEIRRVRDDGHEVMLATGRSVSMTLPIIDRLGIAPRFVVCANGAITLGRDPAAPIGYSRVHVETFDPGDVLTRIRGHLEGASYAVEDEDGVFHYAGSFPDGTLAATSREAEFSDLLGISATRVVVLSPGHAIDEFLSIVERMGLHRVSYNVGFTAWLDIAPDGVNKATALERVREILAIDRVRVLVVGDGRNDVDMLQWAAAGGGVSVAMGQAPPEVTVAATEVTATDLDDGVAITLARHFQG